MPNPRGCATGDAKITKGYKLPARYVIHTVGPVGEHPVALASCYHRALQLLLENDLRTICFCCISTGAYGYPSEKAAKVALTTVRDWLTEEGNYDRIDRIVFCTFLDRDREIYEVLGAELFSHDPTLKHRGEQI